MIVDFFYYRLILNKQLDLLQLFLRLKLPRTIFIRLLNAIKSRMVRTRGTKSHAFFFSKDQGSISDPFGTVD